MDKWNTLLALLRCAVCDGESVLNVDWDAVLPLATAHRVEALLRDIPGAPEKVKWAGAREVFRDAQFEYTIKMLGEELRKGKIEHVLLRGAVMKRDYPAPELRGMADIDYLVHLEDYPVIRKVVDKIGGTHCHTDGGHYSFTLPPNITVEFHPNLIYTASPVGTAINSGWQYVREGSGPYELELTEEGFYVNMIAHLAYHFANGGTGVRSILDVWVYRHRHTPQPDAGTVKKELEKAGLLKFAENIEALSRAWFSDAGMTPELERLGDYIRTSGTYGTEKRAILNAACFSKNGSALFSRVFYPRNELENRYPWCAGKPWLFPAAWTARAMKAVTRHSGNIASWIKNAASLDKKEISQQREFLKECGLL